MSINVIVYVLANGVR